ncbi:GtrA-like protein [compost metagenome]
MLKQLFQFLGVGVINTVVGLIAIYVFMWLGSGDVVANFLGYSVGLCVSFSLNRRWTFLNTHPERFAFLKFMLVTVCAYCANLSAMLGARDYFLIRPEVAQAVGVAFYTFISFLGCRYYVFRSGGLGRPT